MLVRLLVSEVVYPVLVLWLVTDVVGDFVVEPVLVLIRLEVVVLETRLVVNEVDKVVMDDVVGAVPLFDRALYSGLAKALPAKAIVRKLIEKCIVSEYEKMETEQQRRG